MKSLPNSEQRPGSHAVEGQCGKHKTEQPPCRLAAALIVMNAQRNQRSETVAMGFEEPERRGASSYLPLPGGYGHVGRKPVSPERCGHVRSGGPAGAKREKRKKRLDYSDLGGTSLRSYRQPQLGALLGFTSCEHHLLPYYSVSKLPISLVPSKCLLLPVQQLLEGAPQPLTRVCLSTSPAPTWFFYVSSGLKDKD